MVARSSYMEPPLHRTVWSSPLWFDGKQRASLSLGHVAEATPGERGGQGTRDPGGTPSAGKHLCFSPPEPSRPGTLHIYIYIYNCGKNLHKSSNIRYPEREGILVVPKYRSHIFEIRHCPMKIRFDFLYCCLDILG